MNAVEIALSPALSVARLLEALREDAERRVSEALTAALVAAAVPAVLAAVDEALQAAKDELPALEATCASAQAADDFLADEVTRREAVHAEAAGRKPGHDRQVTHAAAALAEAKKQRAHVTIPQLRHAEAALTKCRESIGVLESKRRALSDLAAPDPATLEVLAQALRS